MKSNINLLLAAALMLSSASYAVAGARKGLLSEIRTLAEAHPEVKGYPGDADVRLPSVLRTAVEFAAVQTKFNEAQFKTNYPNVYRAGVIGIADGGTNDPKLIARLADGAFFEMLTKEDSGKPRWHTFNDTTSGYEPEIIRSSGKSYLKITKRHHRYDGKYLEVVYYRLEKTGFVEGSTVIVTLPGNHKDVHTRKTER